MAVLGEPGVPWASLARATELEHLRMSLSSAFSLQGDDGPVPLSGFLSCQILPGQ